MIKYRYAKGSNGNPVDVEELSEETRRANVPYTCYDCGKELIVYLPKTNIVKHFKHKPAGHKSVGDCSGETYLHELGKAVFISEYKDCLENNRPFFFSFQSPATCNYYADKFGDTCEKSIPVDYDLTKAFTVIDEEKQVGDFRPDILLSSEGGRKIFIEIAVTHESEQPKISSDYTIIELKLANEQDVTLIKKHKLDESDPRITIHNPKKKNRTDNFCKGDCHRKVNVFVIDERGRSYLLELSPKEVLNPLSIRTIVKYEEILGFADENRQLHKRILIDKIRESPFNGFHLKNCYLCRYHRIDGLENPIFCKTYKKSCGPNEAVKCDRFSSFRNLAE